MVKLQTVMNMIEQEIKKLIKDCENNEKLREELLNSEKCSDPMNAFCGVCQRFGYEIYLGELFSYGQDMNDSKLRATNGGGSFAIEGWDDSFGNILDEIRKYSDK